MENRSALTRWLSFFGAIFITWSLVFVVGPALRDRSEFFQQMAAFVDESGIETGAFYYTDVEIVGRASHAARTTIVYPPRGPQPDAAN